MIYPAIKPIFYSKTKSLLNEPQLMLAYAGGKCEFVMHELGDESLQASVEIVVRKAADKTNYLMQFSKENKKLLLFEEETAFKSISIREYEERNDSLAATYWQRSKFWHNQWHILTYDSSGKMITKRFTMEQDYRLDDEQLAKSYLSFCDENDVMTHVKTLLENSVDAADDPELSEMKTNMLSCLNANIGVPRVVPPAGTKPQL